MKSIYLKAYLHIFCSFNIAWLHIYILFSFHTFFSFNIAFLLQFFFSFHITFLYSFSDLFYTFVADFALFKTVLEGVYLWAGPEWLILHEGRAQTVLLSNDILFCSSYKSTKRATVPHPAPLQKSTFAVPLIAVFTCGFCFFGRRSAFSVVASIIHLCFFSFFSRVVTHHLMSHTKLVTTATYSTCSRLPQTTWILDRYAWPLRIFYCLNSLKDTHWTLCKISEPNRLIGICL